MLGRTLLPSFGGSAAVWTVCLASFQTLLLVGYLYAHAMTRRPQRTQVAVHGLFLVLSILWTVAFAWFRPTLKAHIGNSGAPSWEVLFCVLVFVGLPYVILSSGSTLVQAWLARTGSRGIYRLYAVSNLGSFLGLLAYPFVFEPFVPLTVQWWGLAGLLLAYAFLLRLLVNCVAVFPPAAASEQPDPRASSKDITRTAASPVGGSRPWLWFALPALSVFLLNAVTAYLTLDVMPLPLFWVVLLGLFLLSYVIGFSGWADRVLPALLGLTMGFVFFAAFAYGKNGAPGTFRLNLASGVGLCFFGCSFIHSWLYRIRPSAERLSYFYLCNAAGGAAGGLFASLAIPKMFKTVAEFPMALVGVALVGLLYVVLVGRGMFVRWAGTVVACGALVFIAISAYPKSEDRPTVWRERGFYGTIRVTEIKAKTSKSTGVVREFIHGSTLHGIQALIPGKERMPTAYFTADKMGFAVVAHPKYRTGQPMRVNLVGLGAGVMLAYARANDYYRCYEISPEVLRVAKNPSLFTFVSGCPGRADLVCQDARKGLEQELASGVEPYDVIVIDAFTGDNLPYHLSTREAFNLYFKMLKPDGILALNVSNWHLDLDPFVKAVGVAFQCPTVEIASSDDLARLSFAAKCAFFCRQPAAMGPLPVGAHLVNIQALADIPMPTDEKGSFIRSIRW